MRITAVVGLLALCALLLVGGGERAIAGSNAKVFVGRKPAVDFAFRKLELTEPVLVVTSEQVQDGRCPSALDELADWPGAVVFEPYLGQVRVEGPMAIAGDLVIGCDTLLEVNDSTSVGGSLYAISDLTVSGNLMVESEIVGSWADIDVGGSITCGDTLYIEAGSVQAQEIAAGLVQVADEVIVGREITSSYYIRCDTLRGDGSAYGPGDITARRISLGGDIEAGYVWADVISVEGSITCTGGMTSGSSISAGNIIDCGKCIMAGVMPNFCGDTVPGPISCRELVNGEILFGRLELAQQTDENAQGG